MAATKTVWWDKNHDQHEGWIKDGLTYVDEAATTRVPVGATVQTAGGTFKMTENGGVPTQATARNQYEAKSNAAIDAYEAMNRIHEDRVNSATHAAIEELNRQKNIAIQNREEANKQAYNSYLSAANPYGAAAEQRARLGLSDSGFAESSQLKLSGAYADQLNENLRAMNEQLSALDVQIAQAKASGQYELANVLEARAQNVMQQRTALQSNLYSADMQAIAQAASESQFREQMEWNRAQADEQKKMNLASIYLEAGMSSPALAEALGISQAEADSLVAKINAQRTVKVSGGGGGNPSKINTQYLQSLLPIIQSSGLTIEEWLGDNASAMGLDNDHRAALAAMYYAMQGGGAGNGASFDAVKTNVREMKQRGYDKARIVAYLDKVSEKELTDAGYRAILETFFPDER